MASVTTMERRSAQGGGRGAFYLGAAVDLLLGLDLVLFGGWIAAAAAPGQPELFGVATTTLVRGLGVVLLIAGADTLLLARATGRLARFLPAIPALNWAFAALMALAVAFGLGALSALGVFALAALGVVAAALAVAQSRALSRAAAQ